MARGEQPREENAVGTESAASGPLAALDAGLLFASHPLPMFAYDRESLRFIDVNLAAVHHYGWSREEFLALRTTDIRPPDEEEKFLAQVRRDLPVETATGVWRHRRKDGETIEMRIVARDIVVAGRSCRLVAAFDVTEQLRDQRRARELSALMDAAHDVILSWSEKHKIAFWNESATRILGWTAEAALGRSVFEVLTVAADSLRQAEAAARRDGVWTGDLRLVTWDGREVVFDFHLNYLRPGPDAPGRFLAVGADVSERRQLELRYLRAQRMESIGALAGGLAHDLNNMLTPVLMAASILRQSPLTPDALEMVEAIESSTRHGSDLVRQILSFGRGIEEARIPLAPAHLLRDVARILRETLPRSIQVHVTDSSADMLVVADPTQLQQALMNLAVNARDAMPDGGLLRLSVRIEEVSAERAAAFPPARPGQYVVLEVTDTGIGMTPEVQARMFDHAFTTKGEGTGLGLPTVSSIVRAHGGFLDIESRVGEGSSFAIHLPAVSGSTPAPETGAPPPTVAGRGRMVLVVDDEASILAITRQTLESFGYRVLTAAGGDEALALFSAKRDQVAAAVVDLVMPGMDGAKLIRQLFDVAPELPIVATSGQPDHPAALEAQRAGVRTFLAKPFSSQSLLAHLARVMGD